MKRFLLLESLTLALHASDIPVPGCNCRRYGPKKTCPAYPEASRYHRKRAEHMMNDLLELGAMREDRGSIFDLSELRDVQGVRA